MKSLTLFLLCSVLTSTFTKEVKVKTTSGVVLGQTLNVLNKTVNQFLGIPYAEPPIGDLRFAKPKPIRKSSKDVIDATKPKNACIQFGDSAIGNTTQSEDCLLLNIWSPESKQLKPVMVFIHGGGLLTGSIFQTYCNGSALATNDVVFVSVAYRLGFLGFLYGDDDSAPGNVGFYDQVLALQWVRDNIHLFGGDKNQITLFGESGGSWSVSAQLVSPISKGLFKRAIMESGALMFNKDKVPLSKQDALAMAKESAKSVNCTGDKQWLSCLRKSNLQDLYKSPSSVFQTFILEGTKFLPITAQKAFKQGKFNKDLEIIAGINRDEGSGFWFIIDPLLLFKNYTRHDFEQFVNKTNDLLYNMNVKNVTDFYLKNIDPNDFHAMKWKVFDFIGDVLMKCPTYLFAKRYAEHSSNKSKTFFYQLDYIPEYMEGLTRYGIFNPTNVPDVGVYHDLELAFVFGIPLLEPNWKSETDIRFTKEVLKMWTNFAKYGKPNDEWKPLLTGKNNILNTIKVFNPNKPKEYYIDLFGETCDGLWNNYF